MDIEKPIEVRETFRSFVPDFRVFRRGGERYEEGEDRYKRQASKQFREILAPYVAQEETIATDEDAQQLAERLFALTNFLGWRDRAAISEDVPTEDGDWARFMALVLESIRSDDAGQWQEPHSRLLGFLEDRNCPANITKLVPTYFLFPWNPHRHFCMKPSHLWLGRKSGFPEVR